ncbi:MAG: hypothetical protein HUK15_06775, partial [Bacteroidales bacterium]|nr:hypothetical protein [Bacteroidales bacterium]
MKKLLLILVCACFVFCGEVNAQSGGDGSQSNPFLISTIGDLCNLAKSVNVGNSYEGKYFKLTNNLTVRHHSNPTQNDPSFDFIGNEQNPFKGNFDGNNFEVHIDAQNLTGRDYIGFFGKVTGNVIIKNLQVKGGMKGNDYIGGIVGYAGEGVTIENCKNNAEIYGYNYVGGICGKASGANISNCVCLSSGNVNIASWSSECNYHGGIVGYAEKSNIRNSRVESMVQGTKYVGGVCGYFSGSNTRDAASYKIENCTNGTSAIFVQGSGKSYGGGIVGCITDNAILNSCYPLGSVNSSGTELGGVAGYVGGNSLVRNCGRGKDGGQINSSSYDTNLATAGGVGSVVGTLEGSTIENCYNVAEVSGTQKVGGIVGHAKNSAIYNCQNEVKVQLDANNPNLYRGCLVGYFENSVMEHSYFLQDYDFSANPSVVMIGNGSSLSNSEKLNIQYCTNFYWQDDNPCARQYLFVDVDGTNNKVPATCSYTDANGNVVTNAAGVQVGSRSYDNIADVLNAWVLMQSNPDDYHPWDSYQSIYGCLPIFEGMLPIELTSFTASCDNSSAEIEWTTATEKNNDYFILERSADAENFVEVARINGAGNSLAENNYNY